MIDFEKTGNEPAPKDKRQSWMASQKESFKGRPIGKGVQAHLQNRLVVLILRGLVLSDKVKGCTHVVSENQAMVRVGELSESDPLSKCRKVTFIVPKSRRSATPRDRAQKIPDYCLYGTRHRDGKNPVWALSRNRRTRAAMPSENAESLYRKRRK